MCGEIITDVKDGDEAEDESEDEDEAEEESEDESEDESEEEWHELLYCTCLLWLSSAISPMLFVPRAVLYCIKV